MQEKVYLKGLLSLVDKTLEVDTLKQDGDVYTIKNHCGQEYFVVETSSKKQQAITLCLFSNLYNFEEEQIISTFAVDGYTMTQETIHYLESISDATENTVFYSVPDGFNLTQDIRKISYMQPEEKVFQKEYK